MLVNGASYVVAARGLSDHRPAARARLRQHFPCAIQDSPRGRALLAGKCFQLRQLRRTHLCGGQAQ